MSKDCKVSNEMRQRLMGEERQLRSTVEAGMIASGDSIPVSWDPQFAAKNKIGRYGRMTMDGCGFVYHVAPRDIDRTQRYDLDPVNSIPSVNRWMSGERMDVPIGKTTGAIVTVKQSTDWDSGSYEESLLTVIARKYPVVLINPSWKTLSSAARAQPVDPIKVFARGSSRWDEDWVREIRGFCDASQGRVKYIRSLDDLPAEAVHFMGESNPTHYPWGRWIRFIPSPYAVSFRPSFQETEFGLDMIREVRKGKDVRQICSTLSLRSEYVYNPETVDKWLHQAGVKFYVESSFPMSLEPVKSEHLFQTPKYLNYEEEVFQQMDELGRCLTVDKYGRVYDVLSSTTYHSKRSIHPDLNWVPFVETGTHLVTYSSISPQKRKGEIIKGVVHLSSGALGVEAVYVRKEITADPGKRWRQKEGVEDFAQEEGPFGFATVKVLENLEGKWTLHADCQIQKDSSGFYLTDGGKLVSAVTYVAKRGTLVVIPPDVKVSAVFSSLEAVFMYAPRSSPWKSLTRLRGVLAKVDGGTVSHSDAERQFYERFKPVTSMLSVGTTPEDIARGTSMPSQVALNKLCAAPGVILWTLKPVSFQLLSQVNIPVEGWVNGDMEFKVSTFKEMWRAIENGAGSLSFPLGFDVSRIMKVVGLNGFFPRRMPDFTAYTWNLNWVKVVRDGTRKGDVDVQPIDIITE